MPLKIAARHDISNRSSAVSAITVGLINNMPDSALEATERQFSQLLQAASGTQQVHLIFSHLPQVQRGAASAARLAQEYWPLASLLEARPDALIVTGMEPGPGPLSAAPCWGGLAGLVDWASEHTVSCLWSCLAAHAAVLRLDGIERQRMEQKCCGVFANEISRGQPLMAGLQAPLLTPHSRWNDLPVAALREAGYAILSGSALTGADIFTKQAGRSLFVFCQGHPEYEDSTLLKEYRRDVGRFVRGEQARYPQIPQGCFSPQAQQLLEEFRERLMADLTLETYAMFPMDRVTDSLGSPWRAGAVRLYSNWLELLAESAVKMTAPASQVNVR